VISELFYDFDGVGLRSFVQAIFGIILENTVASISIKRKF